MSGVLIAGYTCAHDPGLTGARDGSRYQDSTGVLSLSLSW